jgi:hypothetical protein
MVNKYYDLATSFYEYGERRRPPRPRRAGAGYPPAGAADRRAAPRARGARRAGGFLSGDGAANAPGLLPDPPQAGAPRSTSRTAGRARATASP